MPSSFCPLAGERRRRVVGDGGREQRDVDVHERNRRVEHRLGRRGRDHLDPVWGRDRKIGCQQDHLGATAAGLLGERDPHPPGRAVADEADAVDRLSCPTGRDQDAPTRQRAGCEQLLDASSDLVGLGQPPDPPLAFCHLALVGADQLHPAGAQNLDVRASRGARPHPRVHGRGDEHRPAMRERRLRQEVVGDAVCELRERVRGARGDHEQVGAGQVRIDVLRGWPPCQREECLLGARTAGPRA